MKLKQPTRLLSMAQKAVKEKLSLMLTLMVMSPQRILNRQCMPSMANVLFCVPFPWMYLALSK